MSSFTVGDKVADGEVVGYLVVGFEVVGLLVVGPLVGGWEGGTLGLTVGGALIPANGAALLGY